MLHYFSNTSPQTLFTKCRTYIWGIFYPQKQQKENSWANIEETDETLEELLAEEEGWTTIFSAERDNGGEGVDMEDFIAMIKDVHGIKE